MLCQPLQCLPIPVQCRLQILVISLQLHVVDLRCVLFLLALLQLCLRHFDLLSDISQEQVLVQSMDIRQFNLLLGLSAPWHKLRLLGLPLQICRTA